jgi:copper transport protein
VLALAVALWPAGDVGRSGSVALARACRGGFAWTAGLSVALLAATGLYAAGVQITSIDGLLTTLYGRTLLIKVGMVLGAGALGAASFALLRSLGRDPAPRGLRGLRRLGAPRLLLLEATLGLEVLIAAAILTASSPPRGPEFGAPQPVRAPTLVGQADDLVVSATARPNRPGTNVFTVRTASSRRPPPAPIDAVTIALAPAGAGPGVPRNVPLTQIAPGRYSGGAELPQEGRWRMTVVLQRGAQRLRTGFGWAVQPPDPARPVRHSAARLAPLVDRAAAPCLVLALAGGLWLALRGRRPRGVPKLGKEATT